MPELASHFPQTSISPNGILALPLILAINFQTSVSGSRRLILLD